MFTNPLITLNNGIAIPQLGLGTFKIIDETEINRAINSALQVGYRAIDTAQAYDNEAFIGKVISQSGIKRKSLFITSKIRNPQQGYDSTLSAFEQTLQDLQTDYLDLFLVHWPLKETFFETWSALERIYEEKAVKAIGVSNFNISHLELLSTKANIKPAVNQIELHPYLIQTELVSYLKENEIAVQSWSPLAKGKVISNPTIEAIAGKYQKTTSQITLRWHVQQGYIIIPKSIVKERIIENSQLFDFELTSEEMAKISQLNQHLRTGSDPDYVYENNQFQKK